MSRRRDAKIRKANSVVDTVMRWGYCIKEFSPYHVRVFNRKPGTPGVDFWPTTLKWRDAQGYKFHRDGQGLDSLKAYLTENHPLSIDEGTYHDDAHQT